MCYVRLKLTLGFILGQNCHYKGPMQYRPHHEELKHHRFTGGGLFHFVCSRPMMELHMENKNLKRSHEKPADLKVVKQKNSRHVTICINNI